MKKFLFFALPALVCFALVQDVHAQGYSNWDSWGNVQGMPQDNRYDGYSFGRYGVKVTWPTSGPPATPPATPYSPSYFNLAQQVTLAGTHDVGLEADAWIWMWTVNERMEWVWQKAGTNQLFDSQNRPIARKDCHNPAPVIVYPRSPRLIAKPCSCWDINGDGTADIPDRNNDGKIDEVDCTITVYKDRNFPCWDKNRNGVGDPNENTNGDEVVDDNDCITYRQPDPCPLDEGDVGFNFSTTKAKRFFGVFTEIDEWGPSVAIGAGGSAIGGGSGRDIAISAGGSFGLNWVAHIFKPDANRLKISVKGQEVVKLERGQRKSFKYGNFDAVAWWEGESAGFRITGFTDCAFAQGRGENYHLTPLIYINDGGQDESNPVNSKDYVKPGNGAGQGNYKGGKKKGFAPSGGGAGKGSKGSAYDE